MRPEKLNSYFSEISSIKNVGPKTVALFQNLFRKDLVTVKDVLFHTPVAAMHKKRIEELSTEFVGQYIVIDVEVVAQQIIRSKNPRLPKKIICEHNGQQLTIIYFNINDAQLRANFPVGSKRIIGGKLEYFNHAYQIVHPLINVPFSKMNEIKLVEPLYPLTAGITNRYLQKVVASIFDRVTRLGEWLEKDFIKKNNFHSFNDSLFKMHNPETGHELGLDSAYRKRLAYDELLADQLAIAFSREKVKRAEGVLISSQHKLIDQLKKSLPFTLTDAQNDVLSELQKDFISGTKMFRLLQGDVGSGKTVVALLSMLDVVESGFQAVLMAPTEVLAQQHFNSISKMLNEAAIELNVQLLTGSVKPKDKAKIYSALENGTVDLLIGTHALFQDKVSFSKLGYIVIDEQHRFGVKQRMQLAEKGNGVHVLLMSATPIPRTLSLTLYGDMDVSIISQKPTNRKPIQTVAIPFNRIDDVIESIRRKVESGEQVYWICPLVESTEEEIDEQEKSTVAAAVDRFNSLRKIFSDQVALVHGQMKSQEKDSAMLSFKNADKKILVATTVVEVGVDVPNATVIIIENAEKFGLAQLHQLRGRVGRGDKQSSCVLLYANNITDSSKERLKIIRETEDGFRISEEDLALRGSGELLGTKQSGLPEYNFALLPEHKDLLFAARDDAKYIMINDPDLKSERGIELRNLLYLFEYDKYVKNLQG